MLLSHSSAPGMNLHHCFPASFQVPEIWRRVIKRRRRRAKREKQRRARVTVRQRWPFIQHTGGQGDVNKGGWEKNDPISSLREHDRGIKAILKFNGPCRFPSTCNLSQAARSIRWSSATAAATISIRTRIVGGGAVTCRLRARWVEAGCSYRHTKQSLCINLGKKEHHRC